MKQPLRLLTIGHSYIVGMNRRLAHEMARTGGDSWEVLAAAPMAFHNLRDLRPLRLELGADDEPCRFEALHAYCTGRVHVFFYGWHLRQLLKESFDVVHCWQEPFIVAGGQVAFYTPKSSKLVFSTYQNLNKNYPIPFCWIERYSMRHAAGWITGARLVTENLAPRAGYDKPRTQIPMGVDVERFQPSPAARAAALRELNWADDGVPVVGYLGRFVPEKGHGVLRRALDGAKTPWRALFVGAGPDEADLRDWAQRHGDRVRIRTDVTHDQVPAILNVMDVMCAPSQTTPIWKEQFGRMAIEAFASGVAFVGSDSGEIPHVVGDTGLVVGEQDVEGWTRAIETLLNDRSRRAELVARGIERARAEFSWPVVARRHLEFFASLL